MQKGNVKLKITICGSVKFARQLVKIYKKLEKLGHQPMMHKEMFGIADGTAKELISGIKINHAEIKRKNNFNQLLRTNVRSMKSDCRPLVCPTSSESTSSTGLRHVDLS